MKTNLISKRVLSLLLCIEERICKTRINRLSQQNRHWNCVVNLGLAEVSAQPFSN